MKTNLLINLIVALFLVSSMPMAVKAVDLPGDGPVSVHPNRSRPIGLPLFTFGAWDLRFEASLKFEVWRLEFPHSVGL